jgi:1-acyl-sn-glycerol-3-phosphate acyltransferase
MTITPPDSAIRTRPWNDLGSVIPRRGNGFTTWLSRSLMKLCGWRMTGSLPELPKLVITAAPHTSNWDFLVGVAAMYASGFRASFLGKATLFRPPLGWFMRWVGGRPVDRSSSHGVVAQTVAQIRAADRFILALAPEGTRKRVTEWHTGFWRVAKEAGLPIVLGFFDYGTRTVGFGPTLWPDQLESDMAAIQAFYQTKTPRRPELFATALNRPR